MTAVGHASSVPRREYLLGHLLQRIFGGEKPQSCGCANSEVQYST